MSSNSFNSKNWTRLHHMYQLRNNSHRLSKKYYANGSDFPLLSD